MDSALRRLFLRVLDDDFAKLDLREAGVRRWSTGQADWEVRGPFYWPSYRAWWRGRVE